MEWSFAIHNSHYVRHTFSFFKEVGPLLLLYVTCELSIRYSEFWKYNNSYLIRESSKVRSSKVQWYHWWSYLYVSTHENKKREAISHSYCLFETLLISSFLILFSISLFVSGFNGLGPSFEWSFHRLIFSCFFIEKYVSEVSFSCSHSAK